MTDVKSLLGATAFWTAAVRAQESARDDCLFNDPWAAALAGEEGKRWLEQRGGSAVPIAIRTRYFDDFLQRVAQQRGIRQVALVGAGLDTRAFRLVWPPGTRVFELDQAPVLEHKARVLAEAGAQPACRRAAITGDLTGSWQDALIASGYNPGEPSAWLLEGLLFYLPTETIARLLVQVSGLAAPGSWLGCDVINSATLTSPWTKAWIDMQAGYGAPWIGTLDDPQGLLAPLGWSVSLSQPGAADAHYGRWTLPVIPVQMPDMPHNWYVTAEKVER
jgi:methyltransferase (TIGR00027 family)